MSQIIMPGVYMTPLDNFDWEEIIEQQYWRRIFPKHFQDMQKFIEEQCDKLDYPGSIIYDETPDQVGLERTYERIYEIWQKENHITGSVNLKELVETQMERTFPPSQKQLPDPTWKDILRILFYQEVQKRRRNKRNGGRRYW